MPYISGLLLLQGGWGAAIIGYLTESCCRGGGLRSLGNPPPFPASLWSREVFYVSASVWVPRRGLVRTKRVEGSEKTRAPFSLGKAPFLPSFGGFHLRKVSVYVYLHFPGPQAGRGGGGDPPGQHASVMHPIIASPPTTTHPAGLLFIPQQRQAGEGNSPSHLRRPREAPFHSLGAC